MTPDPPPLWRQAPKLFGLLLVWPVIIAPIAWRSLRFALLAQQASAYRHRIVEDGVEVSCDGRPARIIPWSNLARGRWFVHLEHTMASGFEETYAVDLPDERVALGGYAGKLALVLAALAERDLRPEPRDGGRALGAASWLVMFAWFVAAYAVAQIAGH